MSQMKSVLWDGYSPPTIIFVDLKGVQGNKVVDEIRYKFTTANGSVGYALLGGWRFATILESDDLPPSGRARMVYNLVTSSEFQKSFKSEWEVLFDSVNPNRIYNQGNNHFLSREYAKAIPYYETSIKYNKNKKQIAETQKNLENVRKLMGQ